jgi:uncharacterized membrane protein
MTSFAFIAVVIVLFLCLFGLETDENVSEKIKHGQHGLWTWLVSGNWPAKVGAILLIIGIAALMRYALLHVAIPDQAKLSVGVLLTATIAFFSYSLREQPSRRALHLALAGAACGVAYLTAYSAWGLFGYLDNITGLSLLVLVAGAAAIFAVLSNAISIAILAMIGAYIAPAFAVDISPGPVVVYGYYAAISLLSFLMVYAKSWRPLIHLSFLFTLVGGIFFAWSSQYYQAEYYSKMQPLLLMLTLLHIYMPIIEGRATKDKWSIRFDLGYFVSLPIVATILTYSIAPNVNPEFSLGLLYLGLLWVAAALTQYDRREEVVRYSIVAFLFFVASAIAALADVSFPLIGIFTMTVLLTMSTRLKFPEGFDSASSFMLLVFVGLWVVETSFGSGSGSLFANQWFAEQVAVSVLVLWSSYTSRKRNPIFSKVFLFVAIGIALRAVIDELLRLEFFFFAEIGHSLLLIALAVLPSARLSQSVKVLLGSLAIFILYLSVFWVAYDAISSIAITFLFVDILVLGFFVSQYVSHTEENKFGIYALMAIPFFVLPWAFRLIHITPAVETSYVIYTCFATGLLVSVMIGSRLKWDSNDWSNKVVPYIYLFSCLALGMSVLFHIERGIWPMLFEIITLATLIFIVFTNQNEVRAKALGIYTVISVALVIQAMLLRYLGPDRVMTIADVVHMQFPAVVSLIWAGLGSLLAWWSGRIQSRRLWTVGSCLMVIAAVKLMLVDFSSLGELGNILALIAAGLAFLGVAWLVPIPPKSEASDTAVTDDELAVSSSFNPGTLLLIPLAAMAIIYFALQLDSGASSYKPMAVKSVAVPNPQRVVATEEATKESVKKAKPTKVAKATKPPARQISPQTTQRSTSIASSSSDVEGLPDVVKQGLSGLSDEYDNNPYASLKLKERTAKSRRDNSTKPQAQWKKASATWGDKLNTHGSIPKNAFKVFYLNMDDPFKAVYQENVNAINVDYPWNDFHGIDSQKFGAYWVRKLEMKKTSSVLFNFHQSRANVRIIVDKNIIYDRSGSNPKKGLTHTFEPGTHLLEVEYTNHWHTTKFNMQLLEKRAL